jgi:hypothetical protein
VVICRRQDVKDGDHDENHGPDQQRCVAFLDPKRPDPATVGALIERNCLHLAKVARSPSCHSRMTNTQRWRGYGFESDRIGFIP